VKVVYATILVQLALTEGQDMMNRSTIELELLAKNSTQLKHFSSVQVQI
jgi:hypothetical protein